MMKRKILLSFFLAISNFLFSQSTVFDSIEHNQRQRQYIIHIPTNYNPSQAHDLVFVLHGGTGSAIFMMNYTGFNSLSNLENFIVVYPQGIFTGTNLGGTAGHHWADGRTTTAPDTQGVDDVGFISHLIDTISNQYNINPNNVFAAGISNGGYMTQRLACQLSDKISAVATVAATFPDSLLQYCNNPQPTSILITHANSKAICANWTGWGGTCQRLCR